MCTDLLSLTIPYPYLPPNLEMQISLIQRVIGLRCRWSGLIIGRVAAKKRK